MIFGHACQREAMSCCPEKTTGPGGIPESVYLAKKHTGCAVIYDNHQAGTLCPDGTVPSIDDQMLLGEPLLRESTPSRTVILRNQSRTTQIYRQAQRSTRNAASLLTARIRDTIVRREPHPYPPYVKPPPILPPCRPPPMAQPGVPIAPNPNFCTVGFRRVDYSSPYR